MWRVNHENVPIQNDNYKNCEKNTDLEKTLTKSSECTEISIAAKKNILMHWVKKWHIKRTGKY